MCAAADFIIFSYDRPMQLYALLESTEHYLTGIDSIAVIYRTSNERFANGYAIVQQRFPGAKFIHQGTSPRSDFKPLLLQTFKNGNANYILFAPDDIIVKNYADLHTCTQAMEKYNAYGFFLRLGTHLTYCYATAHPQPVPALSLVDQDLYTWKFNSPDATWDWAYPNNVDMTIYRKQDILYALETLAYRNPNTMEGTWASTQGSVAQKKGLCFTESIIVNIPVNSVQDEFENRHMRSWTTLQLLEIFESGKKIDIQSVAGIKNKSCHIEFPLQFIQR